MKLPLPSSTRSNSALYPNAASLALSLLVLGALNLLGCGWEQVPPPAPVAKQMLRPLMIVVTGDTGGRLTATNCGVAQPGGVARRAELLEALPPSSNPIVLDAGGAASGDLPADRVTWEYLLRAEQSLGTAAHNLGREEIALPPDRLAQLAKQTQIPWVSSNTKTVAGHDSGERYLSEPLRVVERGSAAVVILGVVSPRAVTNGVIIEDPARAVQTVLADYGWRQKRPAALVVLADLDADEIDALRASLPPQTLLINRGSLPQQILQPAGNKMSSIAVLSVPPAGEGAIVAELDLNLVAAKDELPSWNVSTQLLVARRENPEFTPLLAAYQRELAQGHFTSQDSMCSARRGLSHPPLKATLPARTSALAFAGSQECRRCHAQISMQCDSAPHAAAWQALVDRGQQHEARCQRCHTTGFNSSDQPGFVSARLTPQFTAVSCEACHGPSAAHTLDPLIPTPWIAKESCAQCHNAEHSPGFEVDAAWLRIQHPGQPAPEGAELGSQGPRYFWDRGS